MLAFHFLHKEAAWRGEREVADKTPLISEADTKRSPGAQYHSGGVPHFLREVSKIKARATLKWMKYTHNLALPES